MSNFLHRANNLKLFLNSELLMVIFMLPLHIIITILAAVLGLFNSIVDQKSPTDSLDKFAKEIVPISQKVTVIVKPHFSNSK